MFFDWFQATKNGILQSSIDELIRLQKENETLKRKNQKLMTLFNECKFSFFSVI